MEKGGTKMKKIISVLLTLSLCLSTSMVALADTNANYNGPLFINGDSGQLSENAIDISDLAKAKQKIIKNKSFSSLEKQTVLDKLSIFETGSPMKVLPNASGSITVSVCTQETSYYCGPATVQQTLKYINGSAASQTSIANSIGTTTAGSALSPMVTYTNNNQSRNTYIIIYDPNVQQIQNMVSYAVSYRAPVMCRLKFTQGGNWPYSTNGHFMNANGYHTYGDYILVTDPNIKNVNPSASGSYYVHVNELYYATHNHFAQEMSY